MMNALIKCYQIIHFWKLEFNSHLMISFLLEKDLARTCSSCSKCVGVYILAEFLSKILGKKAKENGGPYLRSRFDKVAIWCQLFFYLNVL